MRRGISTALLALQGFCLTSKDQALRAPGFGFVSNRSQFYQGMTKGTGHKSWQYDGNSDAQARIDVSEFKPAELLPIERACARSIGNGYSLDLPATGARRALRRSL